MEDRDFIVFGLQSWDINMGSTCRYTAIEISKKNRVLFVNPPLNRKLVLQKKNTPEVAKRLRINKGLEPDLVQISPTLWVLYPKTVLESINWINSPWLFDFFNKVNERRFASKIRGGISRLGFKNFIILDDNSMLIGFYLKELLKPDLFIYLLRDAVTLVNYHQKHGTIHEPKLIAKADLAVANSDFFCEFARKHNPNSFMIGQGCDLSLYHDDETLVIPDDAKGIRRPVIGYTGTLTTIRLDIGILVYVAKARPDWMLVLVGPEDRDFIHSELHSLPNVLFLGRKNANSLPGYIKSFDVALNPQAVNPITDVNYPLKIDEYLAMGKPVVATRTAFMTYFEDITYLAGNYEEYVTLIELALRENSPDWEERRNEIAESHSFEIFVGKIYRHALELKK